MDQKVIGENENVRSSDFVNRRRQRGNVCTSVKEKWSEVKSSLLVKELIHDDVIHGKLVRFLQQIIIRLFTALRVDLETELRKYNFELLKSRQKDKARSYPVAQSPAWVNDTSGLWDNFYGLVNFMKWIWFGIKNRDYYNSALCQETPVFYTTVIEIFQQHITVFHNIIRGQRENDKNDEKNYNIGIADFNVPELKREVREKPNYNPEKWMHPGQSQCRVPYRGKYGKLIKKYKESNEPYGSLQCGFSSSVHFNLFLYLLSIPLIDKNFSDIKLLNTEYERTKIKRDIRDMIITEILILTGDGGHSIREIIFGMTCSIIMLKNIINDVNKELQKTFGNDKSLYENNFIIQNAKGEVKFNNETTKLIDRIIKSVIKIVTGIKCTSKTNNKIAGNTLKMVINIITSWKPYVDIFYDYTSKINIVGTYAYDIRKYDENILKNPSKSFETLKLYMYDLLFLNWDWGTTINNIDNLNYTQLFFALDANRYKLSENDSFKYVSDNTVKDLVRFYENGDNVLFNVNKKIYSVITKCKGRENIGINTDLIPYA